MKRKPTIRHSRTKNILIATLLAMGAWALGAGSNSLVLSPTTEGGGITVAGGTNSVSVTASCQGSNVTGTTTFSWTGATPENPGGPAAKVFGGAAGTTSTVTVVGTHIYQISGRSYTNSGQTNMMVYYVGVSNIVGPTNVLAGTSTNYTAQSLGGTFPTAQPVWSGTNGASVSGSGPSATAAFSTSSGTATIRAVCGTSTNSLTVNVIKILTETVVTVPAARDRKKLGVGEEVKLTLKPNTLGAVTWSVTGEGTLGSTTGYSVLFTAHDRASTPTIKASYAGGSCEAKFDVIEPSSVYIDKTSGSGQSSPLGVQMTADWYIGPEDVNFSKLYISEQHCHANCTGYFSYQQGLDHVPGADLKVTSTLVSGKGWKCQGYDSISGGTRSSPYSPGTFTWPIPWNYKIDGSSYEFTTVNHVKSLTLNTTNKATLKIEKIQSSHSQVEP